MTEPVDSPRQRWLDRTTPMRNGDRLVLTLWIGAFVSAGWLPDAVTGALFVAALFLFAWMRLA